MRLVSRLSAVATIGVAAACAAALGFGGSGNAADASACESLAGRSFGPASIVSATEVAAGTTLAPSGPSGDTLEVTAPFCRTQGVIRPTPSSEINFEVWLPPVDAWNGKYQGVGNGGFAGSIRYRSMERPLATGYAVSATDTGHIDHSGRNSDTVWALGQPEKLIDYSWRAIHETAVAAKAIIEAHYGRPAARSYFVGCSGGGRQALMEAQRFPHDYDGIVAGTPGHDMSLLMASRVAILQETAAGQGWLSQDKLALINQAALSQCRARGGVIDDPSQCRVDLAPLACRPGQSGTCLTEAEQQLARSIYSGLRDREGRTVYPGLPPGSELDWDFNPQSRQAHHSEGFFGNIVTGDPDWSLGTTPAADLIPAAAQVRALLDAGEADLAAFRAAGGKLIHYHGWADGRNPGGASIAFYEAAAAKLGGFEPTREFYRLFMAPGMGHCIGGRGPDAIGGLFGRPAPANDPEHDVVAALDRWVEQGIAPSRLIASRYRGEDPASGIAAQRPWCPHPEVSRYSGSGDPDQASSYRCIAPQQ